MFISFNSIEVLLMSTMHAHIILHVDKNDVHMYGCSVVKGKWSTMMGGKIKGSLLGNLGN